MRYTEQISSDGARWGVRIVAGTGWLDAKYYMRAWMGKLE
jgi:hypothetical protein